MKHFMIAFMLGLLLVFFVLVVKAVAPQPVTELANTEPPITLTAPH